ncbi:MAG TPA: hypothetical protein VL001_09225 [Candidimonas sp.]|nr:hypothetical protein [Candidimonas sp.]
MLIRTGLMVLLSCLLLGCSPDYNWREVTVANGAASAFFPDRPLTQERTLNFSGHEVVFSLMSASVDGALFAVGYAALPAPLRANRGDASLFAASVMTSLYRNLAAEPPAVLPKLGESFVIEGQSRGTAVRLKATVWLTDGALIEGLVTADQASFPSTQADEFLRNLKVAR